MAVTVINNRINLSDLILHSWKKGSDGTWSYRKGTTDIMSCAEEPFGEEKRSDYVPNIRFLTERM